MLYTKLIFLNKKSDFGYNFYMKKIIVISGKQYCGKDTLARILLEKLKGYKRVGIGDAIKIEYAKRKNLTFDEIESSKHLYRADLIELGNRGRSIDPDFWLKNLANMDEIIVPDVRVRHEAEFFKAMGAFLIRVESDYDNRSKRGIITNADDDTEVALDDFGDWDVVVENNSDYGSLIQKADEVCLMYQRFLGL